MNNLSVSGLFKTLLVYSLAFIIFGWAAQYFPIIPLLKRVHKQNLPREPWEPRAGDWVGILERVLYVITIANGVYGFVAVWLTIKLAVNWKGWTEKTDRYPFNGFLVGTAVSLLMAILGSVAVNVVLTFWL